MQRFFDKAPLYSNLLERGNKDEAFNTFNAA